MLTPEEFIIKWNGRFLDFDGAYGNQCMDLMHQYCVEVLGITDGRVLAAPGARQVFENFDNVFGHELFERIPNEAQLIPNEGDIMFWDTGKWGHVAMLHIGDVNKFLSFEQNYPTGSNCHIQGHSYTNVLGWLRYKAIPTPPETDWAAKYEIVKKELTERDAEKRHYEEIVLRIASPDFLNSAPTKIDMEKATQELLDNDELARELWEEVEKKADQEYTYPDAKQLIFEAIQALTIAPADIPEEPDEELSEDSVVKPTEKILREYKLWDIIIIRILQKLNKDGDEDDV